MLAVRRLPRLCSRLPTLRTNATLQSASTASDAVASPPPPSPQVTVASTAALPSSQQSAGSNATDGAQPKGKEPQSDQPARKTRKPVNPKEWNRPLVKGALPAYDFALQYIREDSQMLKEELKEAKAALKAECSKPEEERDEVKLRELQEKVDILEIQSEINLPGVRWKAYNGLADMKKPIYRHLVEQRWREDGPLDLLMERIHQMNVVPDLLPSLHPSLDLRINFPEGPPKSVHRRSRMKRRYTHVEPGVFLLPEQTWRQPRLYTTVFHTEPRLYTLLMVDLDVPDPENESFTTYLHWMQPNLSLSAFSPSPIPLSTTHTRYVPPHPQRGTPYHRYVVLLLPQASPSERIHVPVPSDARRLGFDLRTFAAQYGLDASAGGGAHMWREVWDETVSRIHSDVLKTEEPRYGRPPKEDPYAELKSSKRYI
ncbi:hypothetical protein IEO21_07730 [Rhodonia placenta]|uniref:PEBP-like protein n=1 Tax=Rhodonia placenta TaxID=104341 RepID=A0A8H7NXI9_9APHY|nr:hypothetical protein IEO21_07730 [Postia placenta]